MTLTISIKAGSGSTHNEDVEVEVQGMQAKHTYSFTREVLRSDGVSAALTKAGTVTLPEKSSTGIENAKEEMSLTSEALRIYDILGRQVGGSISSLPNGVYIVDKGGKRTKIMLRR